MLKFPKMPLWVRMYYRLAVPFKVPRLLLEAFFTSVDRNPLHDGKRELVGKKKIHVSECFSLEHTKACGKALGMTINEFMICSLSVTLKTWFEELGDTKTNKVRIGVPVNIRWQMYETYDDVKLENKFAPMPVQIDIVKDP